MINFRNVQFTGYLNLVNVYRFVRTNICLCILLIARSENHNFSEFQTIKNCPGKEQLSQQGKRAGGIYERGYIRVNLNVWIKKKKCTCIYTCNSSGKEKDYTNVRIFHLHVIKASEFVKFSNLKNLRARAIDTVSSVAKISVDKSISIDIRDQRIT